MVKLTGFTDFCSFGEWLWFLFLKNYNSSVKCKIFFIVFGKLSQESSFTLILLRFFLAPPHFFFQFHTHTRTHAHTHMQGVMGSRKRVHANAHNGQDQIWEPGMQTTSPHIDDRDPITGCLPGSVLAEVGIRTDLGLEFRYSSFGCWSFNC